MPGSLAIWCELKEDGVECLPELELHFNLWRDLPQRADVLDIGLRFSEARTLTKLHVYIPGIVKSGSVVDLSTALKDNNTLSAVFNDTLVVEDDNSFSFHARRDVSSKRVFTVLSVIFEKDTDFQRIEEVDGTSGTVITFNPNFCERLHVIGDQYIRFRITLSGNLSGLISEDYYPEDRIFHTAFAKTDIVELRVNERRNFGEQLRAAFPGMSMPRIKAIHYVLVCDRGSELIRSHADFHKMRRLEPKLWNSYLATLGSVDARSMLIYHWKSSRETRGLVDDFIAFAIFRKTLLNPATLFVATVALLGAVGSSFQALLTAMLNLYRTDMPVATQFLVLSVLGALLLATFRYLSARSGVSSLGRVWRLARKLLVGRFHRKQ